MITRPPNRASQARLAGLVLALVGAAGCARTNAEKPPELVVRRGSFRQEILLTGALEAARTERVVVPRNPQWNTTIRWMEEDGAEVKTGQKLVDLDNTAFTANLKERRLARDSARSELDKARSAAAARLADKTFARDKTRAELDKAHIEAAVPEELMSRRQWQEKQLALKRAETAHAKAEEDVGAESDGTRAELRTKEIALEKAEREVKSAEDGIASMTLMAPRDGIALVADHPWEGRKLVVGDRVWMSLPVMTLPDLESLRVVARLSDVDDGRVTAGMAARTALDTYPELSFPGAVLEVGTLADETSPRSLRRAFRVRVSLDRVDAERMRPGMSVQVEVETAKLEAVLVAPRTALAWNGTSVRALLAAGGESRVRLGPCNTRDCVIEDGLAEGTLLRAATVPGRRGAE